MAERSKAVDLSSIISGCVGSNPTSGTHTLTVVKAIAIFLLHVLHSRAWFNILLHAAQLSIAQLVERGTVM